MDPKRKSLYNFLRPPTNSNRKSTVSSAEVQEVVNILNPKKSSGYDLITGKFLKNCLTLK
jgi:hypothetical protein